MIRWTSNRSRRLKSLLVALVLSGQMIGFDRHTVTDESGRLRADFIGSNPCFQEPEALSRLIRADAGASGGLRASQDTLEVTQVEKIPQGADLAPVVAASPAHAAPPAPQAPPSFNSVVQAIPPPSPVVPFHLNSKK